MAWPACCPSAGCARATRPRTGSAPGGCAWTGAWCCDPEYPIVEGRHAIDVDGARLPDVARHYIDAQQAAWAGHHGQRRARPRHRLPVPRRRRPALDGAGRPPGQGQRRPAAASATTRNGRRAITDPATGPDKTYHVQVDRLPDEALAGALIAGGADGGRRAPARARSARLLRAGHSATRGWRSCWTKAATGRSAGCWPRSTSAVLRLVRVAIGALVLGDWPKARGAN